MQDSVSLPSRRLQKLRHFPLRLERSSEVRLHPSNFILPLFVREGSKLRRPIKSMPGVFQLSPDEALKDLKASEKLGIKSFILFGVIDASKKDSIGSPALDPNNVICKTLRLVKKSGLKMTAITDLCFCEYTSHGHCGMLTSKRKIDLQRTLKAMAQQSLNHARAGADMIAPSGMMRGGVDVIRKALDKNQFSHLPILAYSVKYASGFYGPFRDAAESAPAFGDRRGHQLDFRIREEAIHKAKTDLKEGADILMVKPGLSYLDILRDLKNNFKVPLAAYQVSGEYSMIKAAGQKGWLDEKAIMMETLTALKRAGADYILTYFAREAAKLLK